MWLAILDDTNKINFASVIIDLYMKITGLQTSPLVVGFLCFFSFFFNTFAILEYMNKYHRYCMVDINHIASLYGLQ